ncbi:tripartite tricarboxylate transporter permease [Devosia sp. A449]
MELLNNLSIGFSVALTAQNIAYAFMGCLLGTLIGILPGLGPLATISMLLPFTYGLEPVTALIMLAGIYYGSAYGGSTTAILVNMPGETSSAVTVIDGYQMARNGRAGVALSTAAIGSFFAGTVGTLTVALFAMPLSSAAFSFGAPEYFGLMVVGLVCAVSLESRSLLKSLGMVLVGLFLGSVGTDVHSGVQRFTFGMPALWEGIDFIVLAVGIFAIGEIVGSLENGKPPESFVKKVNSLFPNWEDIRRMTPAILRGTMIGSFFGLLPGAGLSIASFFSYSFEQKVSRHSSEFGKGAIEGVAAPEAANNAAAQTAFIPTLILGVPGSATMALLLGAMIVHNIQPGPSVINSNPTLFWGLIASMWIGNLMLVILNLPLVGIWIKLLSIPYRALFPSILVFCCIGIYSVRSSTFDIFLAMLIGAVGYLMRKLECPPAPLILGFVLGPMIEENFRRALVLGRGDPAIFYQSPISISLIMVGAIALAVTVLPVFKRARVASEEE